MGDFVGGWVCGEGRAYQSRPYDMVRDGIVGVRRICKWCPYGSVKFHSTAANEVGARLISPSVPIPTRCPYRPGAHTDPVPTPTRPCPPADPAQKRLTQYNPMMCAGIVGVRRICKWCPYHILCDVIVGAR